MKYAIRVASLCISIAIALIGCERNCATLEKPQKISQLTKAEPCETAVVVLLNKKELSDDPWRDGLSYSIMGDPSCLDKFSRRVYGNFVLKNCEIKSGYACAKEIDGNTVSMFRRSKTNIELNIWS